MKQMPIPKTACGIGRRPWWCAVAVTLLVVSVFIPTIARADDVNATDTQRVLVVDLKDGTSHTYMLSEQISILFGDGMMTVDSPTLVSEYQIANVDNYHFALSTSLDEVERPVSLAIETIGPDVYRISGSQLTAAQAYNAAGVMCDSYRATDGQIVVNLDKYQAGVYVLAISAADESRSVKLLKK